MRALEEERRAAGVQINELRGQQRAWQQEQEAHASRLQLARKQEALLREQNELLHVQVQQQRAASSALEGDVRSLEACAAQAGAVVEAERRVAGCRSDLIQGPDRETRRNPLLHRTCECRRFEV